MEGHSSESVLAGRQEKGAPAISHPQGKVIVGAIHDEPDIRFDAADFDVCFIGSKDTAGAVIVMNDKWLNADSGTFTVVSDLLMGDLDVVGRPCNGN